MKLEEKSDAEEKDQTCEVVWKSETIVSQERKRLDWANIGILRDSTEIREKKRGEEKGRVRKNINKNMLIFILRGVSLRMLILSNMPMILRVYNKTYFNTNDLDHCIPSFVFFLLRYYNNIFPNKNPIELPPIRKIEHQIDFVPKTSISN